MKKLSFLTLVLILCVSFNAYSQDQPIREIVLENGERLKGYIRPLDEGRFLIQTKDVYLEVTANQILQVDGSMNLTDLFRGDQRPLLTYRTYEELDSEGNLILYSHFTRKNSSDRIITELNWGKAPHELDSYQDERVYGQLGNELSMREVSRDDGGRQVFVDLKVPVLPGEEMSHSHRFTVKNYAKRENGMWIYRHNGDYPENRLVVKMVRLPQGAEIVNISPEPVRNFEHDGYRYVAWRRYYVKGEVIPLTIEYRLP
ncbi:MAG: hypothetical protein ACE5K2_05090 [Candidatus Zixiibacteriota bacterium]